MAALRRPRWRRVPGNAGVMPGRNVGEEILVGGGGGQRRGESRRGPVWWCVRSGSVVRRRLPSAAVVGAHAGGRRLRNGALKELGSEERGECSVRLLGCRLSVRCSTQWMRRLTLLEMQLAVWRPLLLPRWRRRRSVLVEQTKACLEILAGARGDKPGVLCQS